MPAVDFSKVDGFQVVEALFFAMFFLLAVSNLFLAIARKEMYGARFGRVSLNDPDGALGFWFYVVFYLLCVFAAPYMIAKTLNVALPAIGA